MKQKLTPYFNHHRVQLYYGDALDVLRALPKQSISCCVTSPPYYRLRDYGVAGQIGLEQTPQEYVARLVAVFEEVRRVLRDDGTLWINLGDSYAGGGRGGNGDDITGRAKNASQLSHSYFGMKPKQLLGIPWRVAFALQDAGWYLRSDIIWHKPNPMPESVTDRPTKAHEYLFLLAKSERYWYDAEAITEICSKNTHERINQNLAAQVGSYRANGGGKTNGPMKAVVRGSTRKIAEAGSGIKMNESFESALCLRVERRNRRTVWTIPTTPYKGAHFATMPPNLVRPCILAGCPVGGVVIDPFIGSGTVAAVALHEGRNAVGIDLNSEYLDLSIERMNSEILQERLFA